MLRLDLCVRLSGYRLRFELRGEFLHREHAPRIRHRRVPVAALLAAERAAHQARDVLLPTGVIQERQQHAVGVDVAGNHQPPQVIQAFGGESHCRALEIQARSHDLPGLGQALLAVPDGIAARQQAMPVQHGRRGPEVGGDLDGIQQVRFDRTVAGKRVQGSEFANGQVGAGHGRVAASPAADEHSQGALHARQRAVRYAPARLAAYRQQIGRQRVATLALRREVADKSIAIEIGRQIVHHVIP